MGPLYCQRRCQQLPKPPPVAHLCRACTGLLATCILTRTHVHMSQGMGEPLHNMEAVLAATDIMCDHLGLHMSHNKVGARHRVECSGGPL